MLARRRHAGHRSPIGTLTRAGITVDPERSSAPTVGRSSTRRAARPPACAAYGIPLLYSRWSWIMRGKRTEHRDTYLHEQRT